jgi:hypothetical protein
MQYESLTMPGPSTKAMSIPSFWLRLKKKRLELDPTGGEDFFGDRLEFPCPSRRMSSGSRTSLGDPEA